MGSIIKIMSNIPTFKSEPKTSKSTFTDSELIKASISDPSIINNVTKNPKTEEFNFSSDKSVIIDPNGISKMDAATKEIEAKKAFYESQGIEESYITKILTNSLTKEEANYVNSKIFHNMGLTDSDIKRLLNEEITYEDLMKEIYSDKDTSRLEKLVESNMLSNSKYHTLEDIDNAINNLNKDLQNKINECTNQEQKYYLQQVLNMLNMGVSLNDALNVVGVPYEVNSPYSNLNYKTLLTKENLKLLTDTYNQKQKLLADKEYVKTESSNYIDNVLKYQLENGYTENSGQNEKDSSILDGIKSSATPDASTPGNYLDYYVTDTKQKVAIISALINGDAAVTDGGAYVNGVPISANSDEIFNHYRQWYEVMTDDEKKTFNYIYNTKGAESAYEYLQNDALQKSLDQRYYYQKQQNDSKWAENNAVAASVLSVVMTPVEGLGSMLSTNGTLLHNALTGDNKEILRSDNISTGTNYRSAVSQKVGKDYGALGQFAYDAGMSMADFAVLAVPTMATGGTIMAGAAGTTMLLSNMGTRVYVSAFNDAKDRGLTDADAVKEAWVYTGVETALERIPLKNLSILSKSGAGEAANTLTYRVTKSVTDRVLKNVTDPKMASRLTKAINMTGAIVSESITEGNEELATDILDSIADNYIAGEKSTFNLKANEYVSKGYSEDDAVVKAMQDTAGEWARDWALGFVSGAGFGGAAGAVNSYRSNTNNIADTTKAVVGDVKSILLDNTGSSSFFRKKQTITQNSNEINNMNPDGTVEEKTKKREAERTKRIEQYTNEALQKITQPGELSTLEEKINRINELENDKTFVFSYYYRTPSGRMYATGAFFKQKSEYERLKQEVLVETGLASAFDYMIGRHGKGQIDFAIGQLKTKGDYSGFSRINGNRNIWMQFTPEQLENLYNIYSNKVAEEVDNSSLMEFQVMGVIDYDTSFSNSQNENIKEETSGNQIEPKKDFIPINELKDLVDKGTNATDLSVPMEYISVEAYKRAIVETVLENVETFTDENVELFAKILTDYEMHNQLVYNDKFQDFIVQSLETNPNLINKLLDDNNLWELNIYLKKPKILEYLSNLNQEKRNNLINNSDIGDIINQLYQSYIIPCEKISELSNFEFEFSKKNGFVVKNQLPGKYFTITYNDGGYQETYTTGYISSDDGELSLEGLLGKSGLLRRAKYGEVTIESIEVNEEKSKLVFDLSDVKENAVEIEILINGRKKIYTVLKGKTNNHLIDLNERVWEANPNSVEILSFKPLNIGTDDAYLYEITSLDSNGKTTIQYISINDLNTFSKIRVLEGLNLTPISQSEVLEKFPRVNNELILSDNKYGGNQSDVASLVSEYFLSPIKTILNNFFKGSESSIRKQKSELLISKIKEYYPDATDIEMVNLAKAYASSGCGYMAVANTLALYMSSLPNGEKFFYDNFGFPLSFSENGETSYNLEAIAFDLFLYTQSEGYNYKAVKEAIKEANGTGPATIMNYFVPYFAKHNIKLDYRFSEINYDSIAQSNLIKKILDTEGFHILSAGRFDIVKQSNNNSNTNLDSAILLSKIMGNYISDVGGHAMLVTDVSDDMELIVSSWSDKYKFISNSVEKNKEKGNKKNSAPFMGIGTLKYSIMESNSNEPQQLTLSQLVRKELNDHKENASIPESSITLYDARTMPLSEDEVRRSAQQKILAGVDMSSLETGEKMKLGTRNVVREIDGYELKSDHVYRAISKELYQIYLENGYINGPNENDEYIPGENNAGVDWFLGGTAPRYGEVIIECPADKNYFVPTLDNGCGLAKDPLVRHMKSSESANPVPMSMVKVIKHPDYGIIDNDVLKQQLTRRKQELDEYANANNTTLEELGKPDIKIDVDDVKFEIRQKTQEIMDISKREEEVTTKVMETLQDDSSHLVGLNTKLKSHDSLIRKISTDLNKGEYSEEQILENIYDALRYTLVIDDEVYLEKAIESLEQLKKKGYEIIKVDNKWGNEYYQGINVKLKSPKGARLELQFHTKESHQAKEEDTHLYYEIARNDSNKLVNEEISEKANDIQRYYQGLVSRPKGVLEYKYDGG